jgi:hypothetical protein
VAAQAAAGHQPLFFIAPGRMVLMSLAKKVGKVCLGLAAGGMVLNPALAQQGNSVSPDVVNKGAPAPKADKEVTLAPDGSFRVAVLTRGGFLVPGATLTLASVQKDAGEPVKALTGTRGLTTISGLKPGLYRARVDSPQGAYEGTLLLRSIPVANVSLVPPPLVTFMLMPSHPPDCDENGKCRRDGACLEELEGAEVAGEGGIGAGGLLLPALGLTAGAAAIALPIALSQHHHRRASP